MGMLKESKSNFFHGNECKRGYKNLEILNERDFSEICEKWKEKNSLRIFSITSGVKFHSPTDLTIWHKLGSLFSQCFNLRVLILQKMCIDPWKIEILSEYLTK